MSAPQHQSQPKRRANPVFATVALLAMLALCVAGAALALSGDESQDPAVADRAVDAEIMCEEFIGRRLKAPATAKYSHTQTLKDGARYTVSGHVDAENSFGAMVRTDYTCVVADQGNGKWSLVDLSLRSR